MRLIVGLGNIGAEYKNTRHNIGFEVIDTLASTHNISISKNKFKGEYGEGFIAGEKVILIKPSTYMNLSGECIIEFVNFYKIPKEEVIIIYDDISLEVGRLRLRDKGSAGGHNGIKNIILHFQDDVFERLKVGVGAPKNDLISHVLGKFSHEENQVLEKINRVCCDAIETIIKDDFKAAMNKFNSTKIEGLGESND